MSVMNKKPKFIKANVVYEEESEQFFTLSKTHKDKFYLFNIMIAIFENENKLFEVQDAKLN